MDIDSEQYVREQRYLSEQGELLKLEENRRRLDDMKKYLEVQRREKIAKDAQAKLANRAQSDTTLRLSILRRREGPLATFVP